jgi:hypothetical protein
MNNLTFFTFEMMAFILFGICLWHALRQKPEKGLELVFALIFGVLLEWMTLHQLKAYHYGQFLVMIDGAPICIGLGWAVIIYSGMEFVEILNTPEFSRPFLVAFLALNIDMAMDAVAIRLGFWNWVIPLDWQWFGVPWGNFWAWFIVVASYSGLLYWLRHVLSRKPNALLRWTYPFLALVVATMILAFTNWLYVVVFAQADLTSALGFVLIFLAGFTVVYVAKPAFKPNRYPDWEILLVPLTFHVLYLIFGFIRGIFRDLPILMVISVVMFVLGMALHYLPHHLAKRPGIRGG